jgi:hypothetical protein
MLGPVVVRVAIARPRGGARTRRSRGGVSWGTANTAVLEEGRRVLIDDPDRFECVAVIGVDEHVWRHTRRGDKYVTVIIDLTGIRAGSGPARLLDMVRLSHSTIDRMRLKPG